MKAMIIYDDADYAGRAKFIFDRATEQAGDLLHWAVKPWQLKMLNSPEIAIEALDDAADAHLILFGLRDPRVFPEWLEAWLEKWAAARQIPGAALAVLGGPDGDLLSATDVPELSRFADRNGLSLIFGGPESAVGV
jgi:hypothetical protein